VFRSIFWNNDGHYSNGWLDEIAGGFIFIGMIKLKDILSEAETDPKKAFGDIVFGDTTEEEFYKKFVRLQGKTGSEKNTKIEDKILYYLLQWVSNSDGYTSLYLHRNKDLFKNGKTKFPSIFKPETPNGTEVYRGLRNIPKSLISSLQKKFDQSDYTKVKIGGKVFYRYDKPISYEPERDVQSWTSSENVAKKFAKSGILTSKQNDEYFFNQKAMNYLFSYIEGGSENEILHFGKKYSNPVFIALSLDVFQSEIK
jgi:hypothetical protein